MLECSGCKKSKPSSQFSKRKDSASKRGFASRCHTCRNVYLKKLRTKRTNTGFWVYYLPEEHYCGITTWVDERMREHRKKGKNTNEWKILYHADHLADAYRVEASFHLLGMYGLKPL